jgi:hypothetical protein
MEKIREDMTELFRDRLSVSVAKVGQSYQKPYDHRFDTVPYPQGARIPEFSKFSSESGRSTVPSTPRQIGRWGSFSCSFIFFIPY